MLPTEKAKTFWQTNKNQIGVIVVSGLILGMITVGARKLPAPKIVKEVANAAK